MNLKDALERGIGILKLADIEAPAVEAGVILCHVLKCDKSFLYAHGDYKIGSSESTIFFSLIGKRAKGMPVQYITGKQEFMSLNFSVSPDVLIPRQDTEILVETIISHVQKSPRKDLSILDIGTGSGCIAISLANYIKECRVTALDLSEKALAVAHKNAVKNMVGGRIAFLKSYLFEGLRTGTHKFDIIVSNPPYIPSGEIPELQMEVKNYEPLNALDGGPDGLYFYRAILKNAKDFLVPNGLIAFETGYNQARDVASLMSEKYYDISIIKDLSQIERVVTGHLKPI